MTVTLLLKYRVSLQQQTHSVRIDMTVTLLLKCHYNNKHTTVHDGDTIIEV